MVGDWSLQTVPLCKCPIRQRTLLTLGPGSQPKEAHVRWPEYRRCSILDGNTYPVSIFKELYHLRWPVEEQYKVMKCRVEVENFSGISVLAVYQDFHAKVFTTNLVAILARPAQEEVTQASVDEKHLYQVNMTNALSKMKDTVVLLFHRISILPLLRNLWQLMIKTIEPIRPDR